MRTQDIDGTYDLRRFQHSRIINVDREDILWNQIGSFGKWQCLIFIIIFPISFLGAFQDFDYLFIAPTDLQYWCHVVDLDRTDWTIDQIKEISLPKNSKNLDNEYCYQYDRNYKYLATMSFSRARDEVSRLSIPKTIKCQEYSFNTSIYKSTVTSDWNLVCHNTVLSPTIQSGYAFGILVGCFIGGLLSDRFGRRPILQIFLILWFIMGVVEAVSNGFIMYTIFRFLLGVFCFGAFIIAFVLMTEIVGPSHRSMAGMLYQIPFSLGFSAITGIAYFIREWRYLQYVSSFTSAIVLLSLYFIPESPRWLIVNGRLEEAKDILEVASRRNGKMLNRKNTKTIVDEVLKANKHEFMATIKESTCKETCESTWTQLAALFRTREMCKRTILIYIAWFSVSLLYYGLSLDTGFNKEIDPYLKTFAVSIVEVPAEIVAIPLIDRFGRRYVTVIMFMISGITCLMQLLKDKSWLSTTFLVISKLFATSVFGIIYIYSAELFPTEVRNIGVGSASVFARIAGILTPFLVSLLTNCNIPVITFGVCGVIAALTSIFLPETNHKKLPETIEEVERSSKKNSNNNNTNPS